jgi:hypothetical protein
MRRPEASKTLHQAEIRLAVTAVLHCICLFGGWLKFDEIQYCKRQCYITAYLWSVHKCKMGKI